MFPLSAQNNFYIILSSYGEGHVKKKSRESFISLVGFQPPKSGYLFGKFTAEQVLKSFSCRNIPCNPLFLDFLIVFYMFWKNQESWEPWSVGFWVNKNSKMQKNSAMFLSLTGQYGFTNNFEILNFIFSNIIPGGVSKISTSRNIKFKKL